MLGISPFFFFCNLFLFISNFVDLILLVFVFFFFFLMNLAKGMSILFIFSKNQLLILSIFTTVSFISFPFISAWIFMISFLLLFFFILLFPVAFGVNLAVYFMFFLFLEVGLYCYKLPS